MGSKSPLRTSRCAGNVHGTIQLSPFGAVRGNLRLFSLRPAKVLQPLLPFVGGLGTESGFLPIIPGLREHAPRPRPQGHMCDPAETCASRNQLSYKVICVLLWTHANQLREFMGRKKSPSMNFIQASICAGPVVVGVCVGERCSEAGCRAESRCRVLEEMLL